MLFHPNSVLNLRAQALAKATRTFNARGIKVKRCEHCLVAKSECICPSRPSVDCNSAVCFIMYSGEYFKPSNTGRIVADVVKNNHAFVWERTRIAPELQALLANPQYAPVVIFPLQYAEPSRWLDNQADLQQYSANKTPLFILLDGTWREAKKMFKSAYLNSFPVLGIQPTTSSTYQLREAAHLHQLCTAEVAIEVLKLANDWQAANALADYFTCFRDAYLVLKPHLKPAPQT